jgi:hypothetical protein
MERVWQREYENQDETKNDIAAYIVESYNYERINSVLGYLSPADYERKKTAKKTYWGVRKNLNTTPYSSAAYCAPGKLRAKPHGKYTDTVVP